MEPRRRNVKKIEKNQQTSDHGVEKNSDKKQPFKIDYSSSIAISIAVLVVVIVANILSIYILPLNAPDLVSKSICKFASLHKDARSAITRSKTEQCKNALTSIACMNPSDLYPHHIPSFCNIDIGEKDLENAYLGCYRDSFEKRILNNSKVKLETNSPQNCIRYCTESGFPYAGMYTYMYSQAKCGLRGRLTMNSWGLEKKY